MATTNGTTTVFPSQALEGNPRRRLPSRLIKSVCRWVLAVVFVMAGVTKITDLHGFADEVLLHAGLPYSIGLVTAAALPWLELTCAACLLMGYAVREAAFLLALILTLLLVYALLHLNE